MFERFSFIKHKLSCNSLPIYVHCSLLCFLSNFFAQKKKKAIKKSCCFSRTFPHTLRLQANDYAKQVFPLFPFVCSLLKQNLSLHILYYSLIYQQRNSKLKRIFIFARYARLICSLLFCEALKEMRFLHFLTFHYVFPFPHTERICILPNLNQTFFPGLVRICVYFGCIMCGNQA